jgi:hypothetical protein
MEFRKGQSGVEYLSVYAIAFVILLVVLAAIYYMWGPGMTTKTPICEFPLDINCVDFYIKENGSLTLIIRQTTGHDINVTGFNCTSNENVNLVTKPMNVFISNGEQATLVTSESCYRINGEVATGSIGSYYNGKLFIKYVETDTLVSHLLVGRIVARYE